MGGADRLDDVLALISEEPSLEVYGSAFLKSTKSYMRDIVSLEIAKIQQAISKSPFSQIYHANASATSFPILRHIKHEKIFLSTGLYAEIGSVDKHNMV